MNADQQCRSVRVEAPSRLHFGFVSFGTTQRAQFGGVGVMIDRPGLCLSIHPAEQLEAAGPLSDRALALARRFQAKCAVGENLPCRIVISQGPREHIGLGAGTQLGLAIVAGLAKYFDKSPLGPEQLAATADRGRRSSIGSHGFFQGGLLLDHGKARPTGQIAPLADRVELPDAWRWVLVCKRDSLGLSGRAEQRAFRQLPAVPREVAATLETEAAQHMLPSARAGDLEGFGESVYRFGVTAGGCFASQQGGAFASAEIAQLVARIRDCGVRGVGQSSWGPTVFSLHPTQHAAEDLIQHLREMPQASNLEFAVAHTQNAGARIEIV